jgi:drug/metabolite transporter (DMT)-like permease
VVSQGDGLSGTAARGPAPGIDARHGDKDGENRAMSAPWLIVLASFLFATMGVCVKLASAQFAAGEIVFYRGMTGALMMVGLARLQRGSLATRVPAMHFWRSLTGVVSLCLWFYAIGNLPFATAMTLNYMSSVWMALFLVGGAVAMGTDRVDGRTVATVLLGFAGIALVLRPTIEQQQLWYGVMGLLSGMLAATAFLQITALGRVGEPEYRIVFYFSIAGIGAGALTLLWTGVHTQTPMGIALLLAVGLLATVAQLLMTRAYSTGRTLINASLQYLGIAFSFGYGVLLFDERVTLPALLGMVLIVGAGLFATLLRSRNANDPGLPSAES